MFISKINNEHFYRRVILALAQTKGEKHHILFKTSQRYQEGSETRVCLVRMQVSVWLQ